MNTIILHIFDSVRMEYPLTKAVEKKINDEIKSILESQKEKLLPEDYEQIRSLLFESGLVGEQQGFLLGFRFAVDLLLNRSE